MPTRLACSIVLIAVALSMAITVFYGPVAIALAVKDNNTFHLVLLTVIYTFVWLYALAFMIDASAYLYGTRRPYMKWPFGLSYRAPLAATPVVFVVTALSSYAITLLALSLAYLYISTKDELAFTSKLDTISSIYYTVGNAVTAGAGEIAAKSNSARIITTIEYVVSFLYTILLFSGISGFAARRTVNAKEVAAR
jgi:hypothetical protein